MWSGLLSSLLNSTSRLMCADGKIRQFWPTFVKLSLILSRQGLLTGAAFKRMAHTTQKVSKIRQIKHLQTAEVQKVKFSPTSSIHMTVQGPLKPHSSSLLMQAVMRPVPGAQIHPPCTLSSIILWNSFLLVGFFFFFNPPKLPNSLTYESSLVQVRVFHILKINFFDLY